MLQFRTATAGFPAGMRQLGGSVHGRVAVETARPARSGYARFRISLLSVRREIHRDVDGLRGQIPTMAPRRARFSPALAHRIGGVLGALARNAGGGGLRLSTYRLAARRCAANRAADVADGTVRGTNRRR